MAKMAVFMTFILVTSEGKTTGVVSLKAIEEPFLIIIIWVCQQHF